MTLALEVLGVYVLVCVAVTAMLMVKNLTRLTSDVPVAQGDGDLFAIGVILVILTSPFWMPGVVIKTALAMWKEFWVMIADHFEEEKLKREEEKLNRGL
jgi:hypothetical protein